jgi:hypothetical protein
MQITNLTTAINGEIVTASFVSGNCSVKVQMPLESVCGKMTYKEVARNLDIIVEQYLTENLK